MDNGALDKGTPIGQARGLGSAHDGTADWTLQRYTALGNILLISWFATSLLLIPKLDYGSLHDWLAGLVPASLMIMLILSVFWHARNGLQILFDDYIHEKGNLFGVSAVFNLLFAGGAVFGIVCVLKIALGVPA
jgi:succinate dehydrogenase / fumarate reductase membrane anchor subunit